MNDAGKEKLWIVLTQRSNPTEHKISIPFGRGPFVMQVLHHQGVDVVADKGTW